MIPKFMLITVIPYYYSCEHCHEKIVENKASGIRGFNKEGKSQNFYYHTTCIEPEM